MKTRMLLSTALVAIVALAMVVPTGGQFPSTSGLTIHWQIVLRGSSAADWASAEYTFQGPTPSVKQAGGYAKFTVEAVTPGLPDGSKLGVFIGPTTSPAEPYGTLVGTISIEGGSGALVMFGARVPTVQKGTTVTVVYTHTAPNGENRTLKGTF